MRQTSAERIFLFILLATTLCGCGGGYGQSTNSQFPADISGTYTFTLKWAGLNCPSAGCSFQFKGNLKQSSWQLCNGNLLCNGSQYENQLTGSVSLSWCMAHSFSSTAELFFNAEQPGNFQPSDIR
jgi:hypothetical protein